MKLALFIFLFSVVSIQTIAQFCTPDNRFSEIDFFTNNQIDSELGVVYGTAPTVTGETQELILNIFYPGELYDTLPARPLIVLMHSGLFLGGSLSTLDTMCVEFAKRGFVAATIEYRKGWEYVENCQSVTLNTVISANRAIYRGIQDLHASLRYLVHYAAEYKIDTSWVFCGGISAGAFAAVDLAFITPVELFNLWPYCNNPLYGPPLGFINAGGNTLTDAFTIKGLFHNWGSIIDIDFIKPSNAIPVIGFAGDLDIISPIDSGFFQGCENYELMFGTEAICQRLTECGACTEMNKKIHGGHGVYNLTYEQGLFRIGKASCFFKSIFCNNCTSSFYTDSVPANCSLYTSEEEIVALSDIQLVPNPCNGMLTILGESVAESEIRVYDCQGKLVHDEPYHPSDHYLDLCHLGKGLYIVSIGSDKEKVIIR